MKHYLVHEIFYSLQGEGANTGRPAVFVRFSGCDLNCPWCDSKGHEKGQSYTKEQLESAVERLSSGNHKDICVVLTGGEPTLQITEEEELFHGFYRCIETNGLHPIPSWIEWKTVSPKSNLTFSAPFPNEIKLVFEPSRIPYFDCIKSLPCLKYIQPLELDGQMNLPQALDYVLKNPQFRLSLQTHKLIGIR